MRLYVLFVNLFLCIYITGCGLNQEDIRRREDYLRRAHVYYINKKYANALHQANLALEIDPESKPGLIQKGWSLYFLSKYDDSEEAFKTAYKLDDTDPWIHYGLGSLAFKKGLQATVKLDNLEKKIRKNPEKKEKMQDIIKKHEEEIPLWFNMSLEHFRKALEVSPEIYDLHKMISFIYIGQGIENYPQAIESLDTFIGLVDKEHLALQESIKNKQKERMKAGILQKEMEILDSVIATLERQITQNRQEYRSMQELVGDLFYQMARQASKKAGEAATSEQQEEYRKKMKEYTANASNRLKIILKTAPEASIHYRNLADIAQIQGDYESASKYLQEYLERYPLENPQDRVNAKMEMENLKNQAQKEKEPHDQEQ